MPLFKCLLCDDSGSTSAFTQKVEGPRLLRLLKHCIPPARLQNNEAKLKKN